MRERRLVAALIYATTTVRLFGYGDFLYGAGPRTSHLAHILIAGTSLFGIACALSFFVPQWATVCALSAAALSWPLLSLQFGRMGWGRNLVWLISYEPDTPTAILSLIVSSVYAICQLRLLLRTGSDLRERKMRWALPATVLYAVAVSVIANWPTIWEWCFKLRYGG
jgi:hypothetical protein